MSTSLFAFCVLDNCTHALQNRALQAMAEDNRKKAR
jgi:hypothetical protein